MKSYFAYFTFGRFLAMPGRFFTCQPLLGYVMLMSVLFCKQFSKWFEETNTKTPPVFVLFSVLLWASEIENLIFLLFSWCSFVNNQSLIAIVWIYKTLYLWELWCIEKKQFIPTWAFVSSNFQILTPPSISSNLNPFLHILKSAIFFSERNLGAPCWWIL